MQALPIGIQTFKDIRTSNYLYIDKTKEALELIQNYRYVFLSRPRRFGKSLFLDTLHNIFDGNKELFKDLYIYNKYDWNQKYPVIKIDWSGDLKSLASTKKMAEIVLKENQRRLGIECEESEPSACLRELIQKTYEKYQQKVVVLIDEYDKPILDNLDDIQRAKENRDFLRGVYIQLKANDAYIHFAFLTGISKFAKASIFSGLNNLVDISLLPKYGNICGYTHENIKNEFFEYSKEYDLEKIKEWYNGYYFLKDRIYNPFDILRLFDSGRFKNYWWESGQAYSLIQMLKQKHYYIPELENLIVSEDFINSFEIENLRLEVLLYQAGYLTIEKMEYYEEYELYNYKLKVPNKEVQISFNNLVLEYLTNEVLNPKEKVTLLTLLKEAKLEEFKQKLESLFASIPYNNYVKNEIGTYEGYYASVIYAYLASLGVKIVAEDVSSLGRVDITLFLGEKIYIIEFKVDSKDALKQIKQKEYYKKYLNKNKDIILVGISFDSKVKNIKSFEWERVFTGCEAPAS